ncbi:arginine--tRNA ligase [Fodinicola acaciae]|uniref:arginine--tRNA ligase n=1 Tax=Fodinicola acaciae TaxID=2681555 RepID=UPI0013D4D073|nr:arginine--tRNA ligase [Fodinicola acaciae]
MTPDAVSAAVLDVVRATFVAHDLDTSALPETTTVERPRNRDHGDYATTIALQLAKKVGVPPRELAGWIGERLAQQPGIASAEVAGPGFLNIRLEAAAAGQLARTIVEAGAAYGRVDLLKGQRVNVEFVSANPTGPVHLGHTRWAAVGDVLARVFAAAGAEVAREFYINDRGAQLNNFGRSLVAAALGEPTPENGYHGEYVADIARAIVADRPEIVDLPEDERLVAFREEGYRRQLEEQEAVLAKFRTHFDVWFSERSLHSSGAIDEAMAALRKAGHVYEQDGAVWMRTSEFGDDKDRPLVKSDGEYTYFGSDAAYYVNKRGRGFTRCLYLLGADHHGYVNRLRAIAACAGDNPDDSVDVLIGQLVKVMQNGAEMKLSKRAGTIITLQEVVDLVGVDAARYQLSRFSTDSEMVLDVDLLTKRTNDNPVYYVQYAHARISSVLRNAADLGIDRGELDPSLLSEEKTNTLLGALAEFPGVVATAAELREVHRIARYLESLAGVFHRFYDVHRVLPQGDEEVTATNRARLWLLEATRTVLANGLGLLGVTAPERM